MEEDHDKCSSMAGVSANLEESLNQREAAHHQLKRDGEMGVDDDNGKGEKQAIEVLLEENKAAVELVKRQWEEIENFQAGQATQVPLIPFGIFPEVVWEQILGELEDSKDILNVFKALPDLEGRVLKNKYWWLFDQVVPHLRPWLTNEEMLSCRYVCKKWAHGVENYMENLNKVFEHDRPITGRVWYPEGSRAHEHYKLGPKHKFGSEVAFRHCRQLTLFLRDVDKHPPARNPFLGRSLEFRINMYDWRENPVVYLNMAMEMLRKCGRHVWFIRLFYLGDNGYQLVLDVLSLVPNLKGLELHWSAIEDIEEFHEDQRLLFPRLPQLESLLVVVSDNIADEEMSRNFIHSFVACYSAQLKRLCIKQSSWREDWPRSPKLRELHLLHVHSPEDIVDLLTSLHCPDLSFLSLHVDLQEIYSDDHYMRLADIMSSWVEPFRSLQVFGLNLFGELGFDDFAETPIIDCISSIKALCISSTRVHLLGPKLLRCFPSLEYASILVHDDMHQELPRNVYRWDLWEELHALKEINILPLPYPHIIGHHSRIKYEGLKKQREERQRSLTDEDLQECLKGFESMVSVTWGNEQDTHADGNYSGVKLEVENDEQ